MLIEKYIKKLKIANCSLCDYRQYIWTEYHVAYLSTLVPMLMWLTIIHDSNFKNKYYNIWFFLYYTVTIDFSLVTLILMCKTINSNSCIYMCMSIYIYIHIIKKMGEKEWMQLHSTIIELSRSNKAGCSIILLGCYLHI